VPSKPESLIRQPRFLVLTGLILIAVATRLVDHGLINVAPVGAIALFGGACFASRRTAFVVPLVIMLLSDVGLYYGRYSELASFGWKFTLFVYLAFGLVVLVGWALRERRKSVLVIAGGSLAGSLIFFLVSNLAPWMFTDMYPLTLGGLMQCYAAGIPFYRETGQSALLNTVLGDMGYNAVLFGALALAESRVPALRPTTATVV
jgi:uncharacterized membrane protein